VDVRLYRSLHPTGNLPSTAARRRGGPVEAIIDLSDAIDTASIDLRHEQSDWAATA
jgi:hypothetical protein